MDLRAYPRIGRAYRLPIAIIVAVALALAGLFTLISPKVYAADASGIVTMAADSPAEKSMADSWAKSRATSYVKVATGRDVAQMVIDSLGLQTTPDALIQHITITQPLDTVSLEVRATAGTPQGAQRLADAWVSALADQIQAIENPGGAGSDMLSLYVTGAAALPTRPVSPNPVRNLGLGLLLGLMAGFGYALVRSRIDRRIKDIETVSRDFGVTVAGAIPTSPALARGDGEMVPIVVAGDRASQANAAAESFLKIRTNLQFMDVDNPPRVIVVTSPLPGDGKSTIAANLAVALSEAGNPVVLVDGDLRRPVVAESFGLVGGAGLTDVLSGRASVADVAQHPTDNERLTIVAAGSVPPNPSELLGSNAMRQFLQGLRKDHVVIVDAPPLLPVTDAAVLTANADGALVVISAGKTLDTQLDAALSHIEAVNGHVLGVVFNRVTPSRSGSSYGYGYYGGHGYYESKDKDKDTGAEQKAEADAAADGAAEQSSTPAVS